MRTALVFPPQWDPRQPPLCLPALASAIESKHNQVRAWDMNLRLYRNIVEGAGSDPKVRRLITEYFDENTLKDSTRFSAIAGVIEDYIDSQYSVYEPHWLFWDALLTGLSEESSRDWRSVIRSPEQFPFHRRIQAHVSEIVKWRPDLIGISIISDTQVFGGITVASILRGSLPESTIVFGGDAVKARSELLLKHPWLFDIVDAICISHGEPALEALVHHKPLCDVPNILWRDGTIVRPSRTMRPMTFKQSYVADFTIMQADKYLSPGLVIPVETARGCPWSRCSFCGHPGRELRPRPGYRTRSFRSIVHEIRRHMAQGHHRFSFVDEAIPPQRLKMLSMALAKVRGGLSWTCYIRAESEHDASTFRMAHEAGCRKVFIGVETGSARLMRLYRKGSTPKIAQRVIREASQAGLAVHLFLMTGFPGESEADRAATLEFLSRVIPSVEPFGFTYDIFDLVAQMGTPLYAKPSRFGATGLRRATRRDLRYAFAPVPARSTYGASRAKFAAQIKGTIERALRGKPGLRHLEAFDDSTHLLLIDAHLSGGNAHGQSLR
jgi:anaerobic magnesium-protoporphyrin IX monomethyl ester cyclase